MGMTQFNVNLQLRAIEVEPVEGGATFKPRPGPGSMIGCNACPRYCLLPEIIIWEDGA